MQDMLRALGEGVGTLAGNWTRYTAMGGFLVYLCGYLTLRFHLTALGLATDLAILDERYLFAGAWFLVVLMTALPKLGLLAAPVLVLGWAGRRIWSARPLARIGRWLLRPESLALSGLLLALAVIQSFMSQCFYFSNMLLAPDLPAEPAWLRRMLLAPDERALWFYFDALVSSCVPTLAVLWALHGRTLDGGLRIARAVLGFLAVLQVLMLPVNYGWLIAEKSLPRVTAVAGRALAGGEQAWLVWEGKDGLTYLLRMPGKRTLLTVPRGEAGRIEIVGFDRILTVLYAGAPANGG